MGLNDITLKQIEDLRTRAITGRALAKQLGCTEDWLSRNYAGHKIGKVPGLTINRSQEKRALRAVRDEFRYSLALRVKARTLTIAEMAKLAHCTVRTAYRKLATLTKEDRLPVTRLP